MDLEKLRRAIRQDERTLSAIARDAGVTPVNLSHVMDRGGDPRLSTVDALAEHYRLRLVLLNR